MKEYPGVKLNLHGGGFPTCGKSISRIATVAKPVRDSISYRLQWHNLDRPMVDCVCAKQQKMNGTSSLRASETAFIQMFLTGLLTLKKSTSLSLTAIRTRATLLSLHDILHSTCQLSIDGLHVTGPLRIHWGDDIVQTSAMDHAK
ncbi:unnamed protein product [Phytophthora lilii]|uniref:Unnamed protein product n=1 Tax=Phytophthora lilii TaxID=2077276 RepID=A0A9W6THM0_9STRA|nr:unnamed protein product [Phytophthora lilii]